MGFSQIFPKIIGDLYDLMWDKIIMFMDVPQFPKDSLGFNGFHGINPGMLGFRWTYNQ